MDRYTETIMAYQAKVNDLEVSINDKDAQAKKLFSENQDRKIKVSELDKDVERISADIEVLKEEKNIRKTALKKALLLSGTVSAIIVLSRITGLSTVDLFALIPSSILAVPVYVMNTSHLANIKRKYSLEEATSLVESKKEEKEEIRAKARAITEQMLALRSELFNDNKKKTELTAFITELESARNMLIEKMQEDYIEADYQKNGLRVKKVEEPPLQKKLKR